MSMRMTNLLCNILFWVLLVADVFAACYWFASQIAVLLTEIHWLPAEGALVFALILGALMTPGVLLGLISLFRRKR